MHKPPGVQFNFSGVAVSLMGVKETAGDDDDTTGDTCGMCCAEEEEDAQ